MLGQGNEGLRNLANSVKLRYQESKHDHDQNSMSGDTDFINYEYVANENINESNILQSTKNKFKKSFMFDLPTDGDRLENKNLKPILDI